MPDIEKDNVIDAYEFLWMIYTVLKFMEKINNTK